MCGRMTLTRSAEEIAQVFELASQISAFAGPDDRPYRSRFNIAPSQQVLTVVAAENGKRAPAWKRWGLIPAWAKDKSIGNRLFNARGETVSEKPSFRTAFKKRRCLIVADGFFEWSPRPAHVPHWFHPAEGGLLAFAGLHEHWASKETGEVIESATVITTEANGDLAGIHVRMPVVLPREAWPTWLDLGSDLGDLKGLLHPAPNGTLAARIVSSRVNSPKNDDSGCIAPDDEF